MKTAIFMRIILITLALLTLAQLHIKIDVGLYNISPSTWKHTVDGYYQVYVLQSRAAEEGCWVNATVFNDGTGFIDKLSFGCSGGE